MSKSVTFKPTKGRILVKPDPKSRETAFGILLPENKERPVTGVVIVGNEEIKEGTRILFSLFGLDEVKIGEEFYAVVANSGVLGTYD